MDEHSYDDGTEQTPQPKTYRPPPMYPGSGSNISGNNRLSLLSTSSRRLAQETSALLSAANNNTNGNNTNHSSLFSFSMGASASSSLNGGAEESMPSMPVEPPSPISRPGGSVLGDDDFSPSRSGIMSTRSTPLHNHTPNSRFFSSSGTSRQLRQSSQPHPISEVRVETEQDDGAANDTFFECLGDTNLAQRTQRSLMVHTPDTTRRLAMDAASLAPSVASSYNALLDEAPGGDDSSSPSPLEVSRVHESALQALMQLKDELYKSNARYQALVKEKNSLSTEWNQSQSKWKQETQQLRVSLETTKTSKAQLETRVTHLEADKEAWTQERKEWDTKLKTAARERKEFLHRKLASDNRQKDLKHTLNETKKELDDATQRQTQLAHDYSIVTREKAEAEQKNSLLEKQLQTLKEAHENDDTAGQLQAELNTKDEEIVDLTNTLHQLKDNHKEERTDYEDQVQKWKQQYKDECEQHKSNVENLKASMKSSPGQKATATTPVTRNGGNNNNNSVRFQDALPLDSSVADRLARMRDSAERAHLIKAHKRDIAHLKLDHEQRIQKLVNSHQEALRKAQKQADSQLTARMEELKKSLEEEYEEQVRDAEEQQREKFAEIQKELMRNQEAADDSLQAALSKISNITQQYEREANKRASLEMSINQLNHERDHERDHMQSRHTEEIAKRRADWETERDTLLTLIQRDCNSAFEEHRRQPHVSSSPRRSSPKGVDTNNFVSSGKKLTVQTSHGAGFETPGSTTNLVSPAYSDIDDVLRETEDLIQSIM